MSALTTKTSGLEAGLQQAVEKGVIKSPHLTQELTPWSTLAITFVGAFFAAMFFLIFLGLLLFQMGVTSSGALYAVSIVFIATSLVFLRIRPIKGLFMEHLMFIALVVGNVLLTVAVGFNYSEITGNVPIDTVLLIMTLVVAACTCLLPIAWARAFAAFTTACLLYAYCIVAMFLELRHMDEVTAATMLTIIVTVRSYLLVLLIPFVSVVLLFTGRVFKKKAMWKQAIFLEPILNGWLVATFLILIYAAGQSMFISALLPVPSGRFMGGEGVTSSSLFWTNVKSLLAWIQVLSLPVAWAWAATQCELFKNLRVAILVLVLAVFSIIVPNLALCLALTLLVYSTGRYKIATLGALCALWILGTLYYMLAMPLVDKAIWLGVMGVALLVIALVGREQAGQAKHERGSVTKEGRPQRTPFAAKPIVTMVLLAVAATAAFGGVNMSAWKQEQIRSEGLRVLIPLAPVDPRSIMQGDYMVLNFSVSFEIASSKDGAAYLRIDEQGIATLIPEDERKNERKFVLQRRGSRWGVGADAWFFKEGDAKRWEAARYGVFMVDAAGNPSLIGLADSDLQPISAQGHAGAVEGEVIQEDEEPDHAR